MSSSIKTYIEMSKNGYLHPPRQYHYQGVDTKQTTRLLKNCPRLCFASGKKHIENRQEKVDNVPSPKLPPLKILKAFGWKVRVHNSHVKTLWATGAMGLNSLDLFREERISFHRATLMHFPCWDRPSIGGCLKKAIPKLDDQLHSITICSHSMTILGGKNHIFRSMLHLTNLQSGGTFGRISLIPHHPKKHHDKWHGFDLGSNNIIYELG